MQVFRKADSGKAPGGRKKLTFRLLIQRVGRFSETGRAALAGLVLRARDVPLVFQFVLIADGYEADIQHAIPTTECAKSILNIRRVGFHYGGQHTGHARLLRIRHIL